MAEKDKDIDALFRAGLADHSESPSPDSWRKLRTKLSEQENERIVFWRKIAATGLLLVSATSIWWYSVSMTDREMGTLAEDYNQADQGLSVDRKDDSHIHSMPVEENRTGVDTVQDMPLKVVDKKPVQPVKKPEAPIRETIVLGGEDIARERVKEEVPRLTELKPLELELLPLNFSATIEETITQEKEREVEVAYTVTIISNGITERPPRDNLVKEIGDKIDKLGGVVYKVDQGFADLQDAKNNLFASLTSKDEDKKSK